MTGKIMKGVWAIGDRHPAHFARVRWRSGYQVPILYGETRRPNSMRAKARTRIRYGLMCGEWTDTGVKVTNISQGFVLSPPSGFRTQEVYHSAKEAVLIQYVDM